MRLATCLLILFSTLKAPRSALRAVGCVRSRYDWDPMPRAFDLVVVAASAGGIEALSTILSSLPTDFAAPIVVAQHRARGDTDVLTHILQRRTALVVQQAQDGDVLNAGNVYLAPADRHLLVVAGPALALSDAAPVHFTRPAADPLFESAAHVFGSRLLAVVLSGGGTDGTTGVRAVKEAGGVVIAQDESTSMIFGMPRSAIATGLVDFIRSIDSVAPALKSLVRTGGGPTT